MTHYSLGWSTHRDGDQRVTCILVERYPTWVHIVEEAANLWCRLSRGRWCWWCCDTVIRRLDPRHEKFEIPASPEKVAEFSAWRGWGRPFFVDEAGQEIPYGDDFERMP